VELNLLYVFFHELAMEIRTQRVVDELWFSFGWFRASAILEDDIIIPPSLDLILKDKLYIKRLTELKLRYTFRSDFGAWAA